MRTWLDNLAARLTDRWQASPRPWGDASGLHRRNNNFDPLRALLALIVIFFHSDTLLNGAEGLAQMSDFALEPREQVYYVGLRVCCFFWMSGFLVTHSWERRPDAWQFAWRRVARLYPPYLVNVAFCLTVPLLLVHGFAFPRLPDWGNVLTCLATFRVPAVWSAFPHNAITHTLNGSLWTLLYEAWCCVFLVVLGVSGLLRRGRVLLALLGAVWLAYLCQWFGWLRFPLGFESDHTWNLFGSLDAYPRLLSCFLSGVAFYRFRDRIPWHPALFTIAAMLLVIGINLGLTGPVLPLLGPYVLAYLVFHPRWRAPSPLARAGDLSYGLFLYGYPVQQLLVHHFGAGLSAPLLFVMTLLPTLCLAYLSRRYVEAPIEAWQQARKRSPAAASHASRHTPVGSRQLG